jgi:hypothetical protein
MIDLSDINSASPAVRAQAKHCWIRKITPNQFRVVPKSASKSKRIVVFLPTGQVLCVDAETGEVCKANEFHTACYHVLAAARRRRINAKRERSA